MKTKTRRFFLAPLALLFGGFVGCQTFGNDSGGPGMTLEYGSVINGRSILVRSATLPDGRSFPEPGSIGGFGIKKWLTWRNVPTKVMSASGDRRYLPDWVEFVWQEPSYPGLKYKDFATPEAFDRAYEEKYAQLPFKTQRLEIKRKVPQSVVNEVIASKHLAPPGKVADKSLWVYIFWTPDGMKMRWKMTDQKAGPGAFGPVVAEGGDDLDQYNR